MGIGAHAELQEILNRIMQGIVSIIITSALTTRLNLPHDLN